MAGTGGADVTDRFFDDLGQRGHEPLLRKVRGTIKFEIVDGKRVDRRVLAIDKGEIKVSRRNVAASLTPLGAGSFQLPGGAMRG